MIGKSMMTLALAGVATAAWTQPAATPGGTDAAPRFGVRPSIEHVSLSPDGMHLAYIAPVGGQGSALYTVALPDGEPRRAVGTDGKAQRLSSCDWVSNARLVCQVYATVKSDINVFTVNRLIAINADGSDVKMLSNNESLYQRRWTLYGGEVLDWMPGTANTILVQHDFVPEDKVASRIAEKRDGLGVQRVDTMSLSRTVVQTGVLNAVDYVTDGIGHVRLMGIQPPANSSQMMGRKINYSYRAAGGGGWTPFGSYDVVDESGLNPIAVDPKSDTVYAYRKIDGRRALVKVDLANSLREDLVYSNPRFDVGSLLRLGRARRIVGATFESDRSEAIYFDPDLKALAAALGHALPKGTMINFAGASDDETKLLIWAGSDTDPGRYYWFDRPTRKLTELMLVRPQLEGMALAPMRAITYPGADGTPIPAYLTLPPGSSGKNIPAIVLPHGGPSARDSWGFDWLVQFFVAQGYAVLQPQFRGSAGYGDAWFKNEGFRQWKVAITDVADAGHWLVKQGIADPARLAIFGWSYGGYAALQAQVLKPDLFKAVVAVAPVTDLAQLKEQYRNFTNYNFSADFIGAGAHVREGSPAQNADRFKAPVLIFQGDTDRNVYVVQSRMMDAALARAGKTHELVIYPGLDHYLDDSAARTDMLAKSDAFLKSALKR
ncbi:alpha/beta hydrolase family protein [Sphingomonas nostoxanthinifaciens]|uniref:alpha/beta hydrolase family protein n=1 Tax=Sphingomonas nostoxanthinifaciens TaxID=2872652 RepID=UPI001CC1F3FA|nr:alpha/beta fold hydrolase [Sphingomonas nostoxanthinifaciens]UAK24521.1 alpha/beta fold hydrolase [Sphingomonas nostoxanthinifaciens]